MIAINSPLAGEELDLTGTVQESPDRRPCREPFKTEHPFVRAIRHVIRPGPVIGIGLP